MISGVCRCVPPTPYALAEPITSEPSRLGLGALPAPEVPGGGDDHDAGGVDDARRRRPGASASVETVG